jgi:hypothetical protein
LGLGFKRNQRFMINSELYREGQAVMVMVMVMVMVRIKVRARA